MDIIHEMGYPFLGVVGFLILAMVHALGQYMVFIHDYIPSEECADALINNGSAVDFDDGITVYKEHQKSNEVTVVLSGHYGWLIPEMKRNILCSGSFKTVFTIIFSNYVGLMAPLPSNWDRITGFAIIVSRIRSVFTLIPFMLITVPFVLLFKELGGFKNHWNKYCGNYFNQGDPMGANLSGCKERWIFVMFFKSLSTVSTKTTCQLGEFGIPEPLKNLSIYIITKKLGELNYRLVYALVLLSKGIIWKELMTHLVRCEAVSKDLTHQMVIMDNMFLVYTPIVDEWMKNFEKKNSKYADYVMLSEDEKTKFRATLLLMNFLKDKCSTEYNYLKFQDNIEVTTYDVMAYLMIVEHFNTGSIGVGTLSERLKRKF